jgi:HCOMODA/2-hydroxy-3-carboxy-muconic semialdehyde decarboxylase
VSEVLVRRAARALANAGLVTAYGHCSERTGARTFLVCAAKPMGMIAPGEAGTIVHTDEPLPQGVLGEVCAHQAIYTRRPDVGGIARTFGPNVIALSALRATPVPRHGFGTYFSPRVPLWDDPQLIRTTDAARALGECLGDARAVVMRGNGAITVGASLEEAVVHAWYLEDAARVELAVRAAGNPETAPLITPDECAKRATSAGGIYERMWAYLTRDDPE